MADDENLDSLLRSLGRPGTKELARRKRREKTADWLVIAGFSLGVLLFFASIKISALVFLVSAVFFVVNARDKEQSFLSLIFALAIFGIIGAAIGVAFDIPALVPGYSGESFVNW